MVSFTARMVSFARRIAVVHALRSAAGSSWRQARAQDEPPWQAIREWLRACPAFGLRGFQCRTGFQPVCAICHADRVSGVANRAAPGMRHGDRLEACPTFGLRGFQCRTGFQPVCAAAVLPVFFGVRPATRRSSAGIFRAGMLSRRRRGCSLAAAGMPWLWRGDGDGRDAGGLGTGTIALESRNHRRDQRDGGFIEFRLPDCPRQARSRYDGLLTSRRTGG